MRLIVLALVIIAVILISRNVNEDYQNYIQLPFGYMKSGTSPLSFYRRCIYRLPYNWPHVHYKSYPQPHYAPRF